MSLCIITETWLYNYQKHFRERTSLIFWVKVWNLVQWYFMILCILFWTLPDFLTPSGWEDSWLFYEIFSGKYVRESSTAFRWVKLWNLIIWYLDSMGLSYINSQIHSVHKCCKIQLEVQHFGFHCICVLWRPYKYYSLQNITFVIIRNTVASSERSDRLKSSDL